MKKALSLLITFIFVFSLIPFSAVAVEYVTDEYGLEYKRSENKDYYIVSGCNDTVKDVVIPAKFNGLPVKEIGFGAFQSKKISSVVIPHSVTKIGINAFAICNDLTEIVIPASVVSVGRAVFAHSDNLKNIYCEADFLPEEWDSKWTASCNAAVHWGYKGLELHLTFELSADKSHYVVSDCDESATSVVIPDTYNGLPVKEIGDSAFLGCRSLTSVLIPDSVTSDFGSAFRGCENLIGIYCEAESPNGSPISYIRDPINGTTLTIYWGVDIDNFASTPYEKPLSFTLSDDGTYYILSDCDVSVAEVVIPETYEGLPVKEIGDQAFHGCYSLTSIEIPNSVTTIGNSAFYYCSGLTSIEIPDSVTTIGISAFAYCSSLTSVAMGNSVITIGNYAFASCSSLTSIKISNSVTTIGYSAFSYCTNLTHIYCEAESQPEGWADGYYDERGWYVGGWNYDCNATIHWGVDMGNSDNTDESSDKPTEEHVCTAEGDWHSDGTNHWKLCSCGEKLEVKAHTPGAKADCENDQTCTVCKHVLVKAYGHKAKDNKWHSDGTNHWKLCSCGKKMEADVHDCKWIVTLEPQIDVPGEKEYTCKVCGYVSDTKSISALKPEVSKPETSKPETSKPETSKPETSKPETSKPESDVNSSESSDESDLSDVTSESSDESNPSDVTSESSDESNPSGISESSAAESGESEQNQSSEIDSDNSGENEDNTESGNVNININTTNNVKEESKSNVMLIVIGAVLIVIGSVGLIYFLKKSKK